MSSNQRSKRKSKSIEPITFDELRDAAGMSGFVSFLNLPPNDEVSTPVDQAPVGVITAPAGLGRVEEPQDDTATTPAGSTPVDMTRAVMGEAIAVDRAEATTPVDLTQVVTTPDDMATTGAVQIQADIMAMRTTGVAVARASAAPVGLPRPGTGQILYAPVRGGKNLYRCATAQEGHSHLEEALYQLLWRTGTVVSPDIRLAQLSQSDLARQLRITDKNLRIALERLVEKRSIEVAAAPDFALKIARRYQVYSYAAILERRRAAGLEWVIRSKGVQFVSQQDVERYRLAGATPVDS